MLWLQEAKQRALLREIKEPDKILTECDTQKRYMSGITYRAGDLYLAASDKSLFKRRFMKSHGTSPEKELMEAAVLPRTPHFFGLLHM
jgi:hypothetical protein